MASSNVVAFGFDILEKMVNAVEAVRDRLRRTAAALEAAGVEYAIIGGNAVAAWVASKDRAAVRNTQDVDFLFCRYDLPAATVALRAAGFVYHETLGVEMFFDGPNANPRDAVHVIFAGEKVTNSDLVPAPDVKYIASGLSDGFRVLDLERLLQMKLTSFRRKDQVHIQDMIGVGLIDQSWIKRVAPPLVARLQELLDDPNG